MARREQGGELTPQSRGIDPSGLGCGMAGAGGGELTPQSRGISALGTGVWHGGRLHTHKVINIDFLHSVCTGEEAQMTNIFSHFYLFSDTETVKPYGSCGLK